MTAYDKRLSKKLCPLCGGKRDTKSKLCQSCKDIWRNRNTMRRANLRKLGRCICGQKAQEGYRKCSRCREREAQLRCNYVVKRV